MSSLKGKLARLLSGPLMRRAAVVAAQEVGGFQRLTVRGDIPTISAGTKVQVLLPSDDMRTYSPIASPDGMVLLGWTHASGPGARFMANAREGDELLFFGPQRSLALPAGPVVVVGDETSVAVAAAFAAERPGQAHAVIQAEAADDVRAASASVGLDSLDIVARGATAATVDAITAKLSKSPDAIVALTGGAELVAGVRDALRRAGVRNVKAKAYWIPGRAGLD